MISVDILKICAVVLYFACYYGIKRQSLKDDEFFITTNDYISEYVFHLITLLEFLFLPSRTCLYAAIGLSILLNSAYTDKKSKNVYLVLVLPVLFTAFVATDDYKAILLMQAFLCVMSATKMFGFGDVIMTIPFGVISYSFLSNQCDQLDSLAMLELDLLMVAVAEIMLFVVAAKKKMLKGLALKEPLPLGPEILISTHILLIGLLVLNHYTNITNLIGGMYF